MKYRSLSSPLKWALASLLVVIAFYVLREHWGHALGLLPYLLLFACPLMHLFHGHGGHGKRPDADKQTGHDHQ